MDSIWIPWMKSLEIAVILDSSRPQLWTGLLQAWVLVQQLESASPQIGCINVWFQCAENWKETKKQTVQEA